MSMPNIKTEIRQCPKCSSLIKESIGGFSNTLFGIHCPQYWSDGRVAHTIQSMITGSHTIENFDVIKCYNCKEILWLSELELIHQTGTMQIIGFMSIKNKEQEKYLQKAKEYEKLTFDEYMMTASKETNKDKIKYCRIQAWKIGNDKRRNNDSFIPLEKEEISNLKELLLVLNSEDNLYLKAEICRELKEFEQSIQILEDIEDKENSIYKTFMELNTQQNSNIVKLNNNICIKERIGTLGLFNHNLLK